MSLETEGWIIKEVELDIAELRAFLNSSTRAKVKDLLGINLRKLETELINLRTEIGRVESRLETTSSESNSVKTAATDNKIFPESQLKDYSWDQSEKFVKLYLTGLTGIAELNQDAIKVDFTDQSVSVRIENLKGKTLLFSINKTCHKISSEKSYHKVKNDYLLIYLAKYNPGSNWSHITYAEKSVADAKKATESKIDDSGDPSAGLMNMMKKLYDEGDADMKRTIAKAWTEGQEKKGSGLDF